MTLRIRLILITTAVVVVLFGVSEWLSYQHTAALLDSHEAILMETADHTVALAKLKATRDSMFVSVTTVRILHAVGTLLIAVAILNFLWYRVVYRPIQRLLEQINIMGRGTWKSSLPVNRNDEIGELTTAFNRLGQQLTSSFEYINTSSRLSALALIGTRLVREVTALRGQIAAARRSFETRTDAGDAAGITMLTAIQDRLENLDARFQRDFEHELSSMSVAHSAPAAPREGKVFTAGADARD